jgi:DNA adenine methylase
MSRTSKLPNASLSPPLKWAGGKRWLIPHLLSIWAANTRHRLVEPFCGGLAIALGLLPRRALLNDINPHAINFYRHLKRGLVTDIEMKNNKLLYYKYRVRFNKLVGTKGVNSPEAAQLFYYLNRTGYNGLCRFNRQGQLNVPFGKHTNINYEQDFLPYSEVLKPWNFSCLDFEKLDINSADFVYADPPYDVEFTQYAKQKFSWEDQERLALWLTKHRGPVVLSNAATPRIVKLYRKLGYKLRFLPAPRMISCDGDRSKAMEVLATRGL